VKCRKERWFKALRWTAVCLIGCALFFAPAERAAAGSYHAAGNVRPSVLLSRDGGGNLERYKNLPPDERQRLKQKLRQWQSLSPEEQKQMRRKMNQLNRMPPEGRRLYQKRFNQWQRLSPAEQERLRRQMQNWDNLSGEEKKEIRGRFK